MNIEKTKFFSYRVGKLAKGCEMCVQGRKLVMFVTGICPRGCFYCPLSDTRKNTDVVFANEWRLKDENDIDSILKEAKLTSAKGAGITGGDPLLKIDRTVKYIRLLKNKFGKRFHIHLYTLPEFVTEDNLKKLYSAGLDEIRLHPDIENKKHWWKIDLVKKYDWDIGVEIPAIPNMEKEIIMLINYFKNSINFLNINELEISDTNSYELIKKGFMPKDKISYGVKGSEELALYLLNKYANDGLRMHYCTTRLKDKVQLANRLKLRSQKAKRPFDKVTKEGMFTRGAIYLDELAPGFGYRNRIENADRKRILAELDRIKKDLQKRYRIKDKMIAIDEQKLRIITSVKIIEKMKKEKKVKKAIVTEYPTWDQTELDVRFVR